MKEKQHSEKLSKSQLEFYQSDNHSDGFIAEYNIVRPAPKGKKKIQLLIERKRYNGS